MKINFIISLLLISIQDFGFTQVARADDISELKDLVKDLRIQMQNQDNKINAMQEIIDRLETKDLAKTSSKNPAKDTVTINTKGRFEIKSDDGEYRYRLGGNIMLDGALYDNDKTNLGSGTEARRARLFLEGAFWREWNFKSEFGYEGNQVNAQDVYIQYAGLSSTTATLGHFKEPFSLETLTSSKYITFMERALPAAFAPGRNTGIRIATHGDNWTAAAGVYGSGFDDRGDEFEGVGATGRVTFAPLYENTQAVHLGASFSWRKPDEGNQISFDNRPESHISGVRLVDTGDINDVDYFLRYGLEFTSVLGPFSLQGEYIRADIVRERFSPDLDFDGWYVYASWFVTGESRVYKAEEGKYGRITPMEIFGKGGFGAWELGLRFSKLDLSDKDIDGGVENNVTVGLNWYLNPQLRFMLNYVKVVELEGGLNDNDEPSLFQIRGQIDF